MLINWDGRTAPQLILFLIGGEKNKQAHALFLLQIVHEYRSARQEIADDFIVTI
jgi:hypothetical protein